MPRTLSYQSFPKAPPPPPRTPRPDGGATPSSPDRRRLLALMHALHYGRVENLPVVAGRPRLDAPGVRVVREDKFAASEAAPAPSPLPAGYADRPQVTALLELLDARPDCVILALEVKHGSPFRALLAENPAAPS